MDRNQRKQNAYQLSGEFCMMRLIACKTYLLEYAAAKRPEIQKAKSKKIEKST